MTPETNVSQETKTNDKELNFRALESKYQRQLELERNARLEAEKNLQQFKQPKYVEEEEEDDGEPYIDKKKLKKEQARLGQQIRQETQTEIQKAVQQAVYQERQQTWLKQNSDFHQIMELTNKFAEEYPELAETILEMPEGFERQKLVYKNIKSLGLDRPAIKPPSIQDKVDANRRSPYYQPSGVGTSPYMSQGDFSAQGQKSAYDQMQSLKNKLRLG